MDNLELFLRVAAGLVLWPLIVGLISWLLDKEVAAEIEDETYGAHYRDFETSLVRTYGSKREQ